MHTFAEMLFFEIYRRGAVREEELLQKLGREMREKTINEGLLVQKRIKKMTT